MATHYPAGAAASVPDAHQESHSAYTRQVTDEHVEVMLRRLDGQNRRLVARIRQLRACEEVGILNELVKLSQESTNTSQFAKDAKFLLKTISGIVSAV